VDGVSLLCALNATKNVSGLLVLAGAVATIFDINPFMYNARNNARCTQARKATHGLRGQHQDVDRTPGPWKSQSE